MATTLTYDDINKGWVSFYSYEPEWMANLGNQFYTFKDGNIYQHDVSDVDRTSFYGTSYGVSFTYSSNEAPSDVKLYKTLILETNSNTWYAELDSELESGVIGSETDQKFVDKEGFRYAYIRRESTDSLNYNELSVIGLGDLLSKATNSFTFSENVPNQINARSTAGSGSDKLYYKDGANTYLVGTITGASGANITVNSTTNDPALNDFCFVVKESSVESFGLRGYHTKITLHNKSTSFVELFASSVEAIKSYT